VRAAAAEAAGADAAGPLYLPRGSTHNKWLIKVMRTGKVFAENDLLHPFRQFTLIQLIKCSAFNDS
jgi:hypothetical protein